MIRIPPRPLSSLCKYSGVVQTVGEPREDPKYIEILSPMPFDLKMPWDTSDRAR